MSESQITKEQLEKYESLLKQIVTDLTNLKNEPYWKNNNFIQKSIKSAEYLAYSMNPFTYRFSRIDDKVIIEVHLDDIKIGEITVKDDITVTSIPELILENKDLLMIQILKNILVQLIFLKEINFAERIERLEKMVSDLQFDFAYIKQKLNYTY